ncbi:putative tRNA pseudouridine synthase Pus10 [Trichoplusia ni]|uniref:tRNA pseudouridine(55) synthase n=1 Tax=Trichoplusia ni TaxID=7111 RepID=A0A7E5VRW1_TRINI|nr:putative tRNA pseudouridine synthase Pus10 [Trichoplusia ni]
MNDSKIIKLCKELGCCDTCCLRYIGLKSPAAYEEAKQFLVKYVRDKTEHANNVDPSTDQDETNPPEEIGPTAEQDKIEPADCANHSKEQDQTELADGVNQKTEQEAGSLQNDTEKTSCDRNGAESDEPPAKKQKTDSICVSCIGVLQEENWPQCYAMVKEVLDKKRYECDTFACALSAPIATMLRERYITLCLKEQFADYDADKLLTPLKEAWKWSFGAHLAAHVGITLDSGAVSPLLVTLNLEYPDDLQELEVLKTLSASLFESRSKQRQRFAVEFTRRSVEQALRGVTLARLRAQPAWEGGAPAPRAQARPVSVQAAHAPLYLGGRYIKLSRTLPQTPWLVNGLRMMHSSVQEIIFGPIARLYGMSPDETEYRLKFMSAGREDVDVRCLGDGRPFAVEVSDPQRTPTADELRRMCDEISEGEQVIVKSLVPVSREELAELKKGEETKCKTYEALCIKLSHTEDDELTANGDTAIRVTERDIANINSYRNSDSSRVLLSQRTPIRVLHRRPLLTRTRRILDLTAYPVAGHPQLFVVRLRTEAGTYVKEWAHGEAGRTRPRLQDALRARADILALDVASVDLPWPNTNTL